MKNSLMLAGVLATIISLQSGVAFGYGITAKGIFTHGYPVHEMMTRKAAIDSKFLTEKDTSQLKNLIDGVRFNDDPEAYLTKGNVIGFASIFLGQNNGKDNATEASHFGDYQFMHAMAKEGLPARKIKNHMMMYAYHCWLSATDNNSLAKFKVTYANVKEKLKAKSANSEFSREELIIKDIVQHFPGPILFYNTDNQSSFQSRALGSLLHMIQDSYAKGHTVRTGWEEGANSGDILYFQDYKHQDSHLHEQYDTPNSGKLTEATLFKIPGAQMAYLRSKQILEMAANGCPWSSYDLKAGSLCSQSVFSFLNDEVLTLDQSTSDEIKKTHSHEELIPKIQPIDNFNLNGGG